MLSPGARAHKLSRYAPVACMSIPLRACTCRAVAARRAPLRVSLRPEATRKPDNQWAGRTSSPCSCESHWMSSDPGYPRRILGYTGRRHLTQELDIQHVGILIPVNLDKSHACESKKHLDIVRPGLSKGVLRHTGRRHLPRGWDIQRVGITRVLTLDISTPLDVKKALEHL